MKLLIQRVKSANVQIESEIIGEIKQGFLLYVCFEVEDTMECIDKAIYKLKNLRIFEDEQNRMNQNIQQVSGEILSISQFTLSWNGYKGHRPSFDRSMPPQQAKIFYKSFNNKLEELGLNIQKGRFGAEMKVYSVNDGPVTFMLEF